MASLCTARQFEHRAPTGVLNNRLLISVFLLSVIVPAPAVAQELDDTVILGGRVMDPETGRAEIASVGIRGDTIQAITVDDIRGRKTINASGQIVEVAEPGEWLRHPRAVP
jgi:hypothetical protein